MKKICSLVSVLDYVLKPIDADELRETFNRFIQKSIVTRNKDSAVKNLLANPRQQNTTYHKLALPAAMLLKAVI